jgi:signal transduction histidine kinase
MKRVIEINKFIFEKKDIKIVNKIPDYIQVTCDKLLIGELFNNLLNNSIKYSEDTVIITISADSDDNFVTVSISDNGIGMTNEQIGHVFDEFYKADESRHDFDSSGLGMPICKSIVERHGGRIWVESEGLGKGSTFYITIPRLIMEKKRVIN